MVHQVGGGWSAGELGGKTLFWNAGAVTCLAELLLASVLAAYILWRLLQEWRQGRIYPPMVIVAIMVCGFVLGFFCSLLRVQTAGGWLSYVMPWTPLAAWTTLATPLAPAVAGVVVSALVLFAYTFPRPLKGAGLETRVVATLLAVIVCIEAAIAVRADAAILAREAWWRPDWLTGWTILGVAWAAVVFWRQFAALQRAEDALPASWIARLGEDLRAVLAPERTREAGAVRGFLLLTILPLAHTVALFTLPAVKLERFPTDLFICWIMLVELVGFTLILVGQLPDRSTFLFKVTVICLALFLGAVNGAAWISASAYETLFRAPGMVASGEGLSFFPQSERAYAHGAFPVTQQEEGGEVVRPGGARMALPFRIKLYDRLYDTAYVSPLGSIGFERAPQPIDAAFAGGAQPAIFPLLVGEDPARTQVTARALADRLVVTRRDRCPPAFRDDCYDLQTTLHADGRIDVLYLYVPQRPVFRLFDPTQAPWLIGVTPGPPRAGRAAAQPLLIDYYGAYLAHLDHLYAPFAAFAALATAAILLGLPYLLRHLLTRPLGRLLHGIQQFRAGDRSVQVKASLNDEIGYLIESFNEMAREQRALVSDMEGRVADRVAEIADLTIRTAQLEERARLSADLHDSVAQALTAASMIAQAMSRRLRDGEAADAADADRMAQLNRHALTEMRTLLTELRRADAGEASVAQQLDTLVSSFRELHALDIRSEVLDREAPPTDVRAMIYRVAQESLNNVVKHSGACRTRLRYEGSGHGALLVVADDGRGFDPAQMYENGRLGLAIMRDRARSIGASLEIDSRCGGGCEVRLSWVRP